MAAAVAVLVALLVVAGPAAAQAPPSHFIGLQGWHEPTRAQFARLDRAGVHTWRANLLWSSVETQPGQYGWRRYDRLFTKAANNHVRIFPVLIGSPPWVNSKQAYPPNTSSTQRAFYRFAKAAVRRYGPHGYFWKGKPWSSDVRPLYWQVWNEPNLPNYWNNRVDPRAYGRLLKYTSMAAKDGDPSVLIVSGGLPQTRCVREMCIADFLRQMYTVPDIGRWVDAVAVHAYSYDYHGIFDHLRWARDQTQSSLGTTKRMFITEFGWGTGGRHPDFSTDYAGQASRLTDAYRNLLRYRSSYRLAGAFWFGFQDPGYGASWQFHTGLFDEQWNMKPAWRALTAITGGRP